MQIFANFAYFISVISLQLFPFANKYFSRLAVMWLLLNLLNKLKANGRCSDITARIFSAQAFGAVAST